MHPSARVKILFQFYDPLLNPVFDFVDDVAAGQRVLIDPQNIRRPSDNQFLGKVSNGIYVCTATPVDQDYTPSLGRVIPFNWLAGEFTLHDEVNGSHAVYNAVPRMAIYADGSRIHPTYTTVAGSAGAALFLDGSTRLFQQIRPNLLFLGNFIAPSSIRPGPPFGNRLTFLGFQDSYSNALQPYSIRAANAGATAFVFDDIENAFSTPPRSCSGLKEYTLLPNAVGVAGNFQDFLGSAFSGYFSSGGWLRITANTMPTGANLFGWFSQSQIGGNGGDGGGDLLAAHKN